jgi:hypothetical protein
MRLIFALNAAVPVVTGTSNLKPTARNEHEPITGKQIVWNSSKQSAAP